MVIDVRKLKYSGKDECSFHFEYDADSSVITLPDAEYSGKVQVNGTLTLSGKSVFVYGEIKYAISTLCTRCLTGVVFQNVVEFDEEYSETEDGEDIYKFKKGLVDLSEMVDEKLMLSIPYAVYCKDDCKGLCSECGANLNQIQCEHTK
ncbi:MAG: DUF177 domain-containing protein [Clostridia bacterium]|nr:DUF177 domain-containing protein [Clostridia bacterium]